MKEMDAYQAAYCELCHTIGSRHGFVARMFLNYDIVFLAMLLEQPDSKIATVRKRCPARLWCRKKKCAAGMSGMDHAADVGTILSYWKLQDGIVDGTGAERLLGRLLSVMLRRGYRKAVAADPEFDAVVGQCLEELHGMERERLPSLDRPADTFARILQAAVPRETAAEKKRVLEQLLYHVGRWIYLVDAWDDVEEDKQKNCYNPISARFPEAEQEQQDYLRSTLHHSQNLSIAAWQLLDRNPWSGVIENILYLGMPLVEELVFSGRWEAVKNRNGRTDT